MSSNENRKNKNSIARIKGPPVLVHANAIPVAPLVFLTAIVPTGAEPFFNFLFPARSTEIQFHRHIFAGF